MSELDSMKATLNNRQSELGQAVNKKQYCLDMAEKIDVVYQRLVRDKQDTEDLKQKMKSLHSESYGTFSGKVCNNRYKPCVKDLVEQYDSLIRNIDINMDRLNSKKAEYENMAYECDGLIGYLRSAINSLVHQIENWTN